ncbi:hypothetical protein ACFWJK_34950, partial [Streptomyces sp. NPDC127103]
MSTTTSTPAAQDSRGSAPRALASAPTPREAELSERLASAGSRVRLALDTSAAIQAAQQDAAEAHRDALEARTEAQKAEAAAEAAQAEADHAAEEAVILRRQLTEAVKAHHQEELARHQAEGERAVAVQLAEQAQHAAQEAHAEAGILRVQLNDA